MASLSAAVGRGVARPFKKDVLLVQKLLNRHRQVGAPPIDEDGAQGDETFEAIEEFQQRVLGMLRPDGRIDPGGRTFRALDEAVAVSPEVISAAAMTHQGRALLRSVETLALRPYDDQKSGMTRITAWVPGATIGYGHLIARSEWSRYRDGITAAQADALFDADLVPFEQAVRETIKVPLAANRFDALVILAFNIGVSAFARSSVARLVNDPAASSSYRNLEAAWKSWNKSQGKVMLGLERRRQCEWNVYTKGVYERW
ncbi:glycoside hydrolase family protein [Zoogloea sp.]|uniref:glycoside hydrolase family protein n=1 Tax=Zoogloea sp. TaxID=49181 RepID=UPI0026078F89|nr:glycoside hydrolase family protein [Zoogloea sp.]MDD3352145.1 glycoside hydrolase family protein [Zoogloea sp.]